MTSKKSYADILNKPDVDGGVHPDANTNKKAPPPQLNIPDTTSPDNICKSLIITILNRSMMLLYHTTYGEYHIAEFNAICNDGKQLYDYLAANNLTQRYLPYTTQLDHNMSIIEQYFDQYEAAVVTPSPPPY